jgi:formylmethanofuran dehydrogenase subunit B
LIERDWICPGCGLLCDDMSLPANADAKNLPCSRSRQWLEVVSTTRESNDAGRAEALKKAAKYLKQALNPLILLGDTDVQTARAAIALADRHSGTVELDQSSRASQIDRYFERSGQFTLTLGEIRSRADLVILLNPRFQGEGTEGAPRLFEKFITPALPCGKTRRIISLGPDTISEFVTDHLNCDLPCLGETLSQVRGALSRPVASHQAGPLAQQLLKKLAEHRYIAWLWQDNDLPEPVEASLADLTAITTLLNGDRLSGMLRLRDRPGLLTAAQVCVWQCGVAPPLAFTAVGPNPLMHSPVEDADLVIRVGPFSTAFSRITSTQASAMEIVISPRPSPAANQIHLAAAIPGWNCTGYVVRADGAMTSHLNMPSASKAVGPTAAEILQRLSQMAMGKVR